MKLQTKSFSKLLPIHSTMHIQNPLKTSTIHVITKFRTTRISIKVIISKIPHYTKFSIKHVTNIQIHMIKLRFCKIIRSSSIITICKWTNTNICTYIQINRPTIVVFFTIFWMNGIRNCSSNHLVRNIY